MALTAIDADGWRATYGSPPTEFDPVGSPETFAVTRSGFDATGTAETYSDTVTLMKRVRQPYPNQALLTSDKVSLSDFVYAGDTISGVTNNSTRPAPKPIALWLTPDMQILKGSSVTVQMAVAHAHPRSGRPVAAVKFSLSDGTTTVNVTASTMVSRDCPATGLKIPCFEATLDISGMTQGATLTIDAVIYPWVGAAFTVSTDADTWPSPNLSVLKALCDRTGAYGTAYAYVDPVAGNDGTAVVSTTPATAAASPYLTFSTAAAAIKTYNNANFSRNSADGGVIRLVEGTTTLNAAIRSGANTVTWPLTIEAADPAKKSTTIFTDRGSTLANSCPNHLVLRNIKIQRSGSGSFVFIDQASSSLNYDRIVRVESCTFDENAAGVYTAWFYKCARVQFFDCDGDGDIATGITGTINKTSFMVGCTFGAGLTGFSVAGCKGQGTFTTRQATTAKVAGVGAFIGFNHLYLTSDVGAVPKIINVNVGARGAAFVGNVFEKSGSSDTFPLAQYSADNESASSVENLILAHNTEVGARSNILYQEAGSTYADKSAYVQGNIFALRNVKTDVFATNGTLTGNWPAAYNVGYHANTVIKGSSDDSYFGAGEWLGEVAELGFAGRSGGVDLDPDFANDKSYYGSNAAPGDYTPGALTEVATLLSGRAHYPFDQLGRAIPNDGTGLSGAIQQDAPSGIEGTATGAAGVTGSAIAKVLIVAIAAGLVSVAGVATGRVQVTAASAATVGVSGSASASVRIAATASGLVATSGTAIGQVRIASSAAGIVPVTGVANGRTAIVATATGSADVSGSSSGSTSGGIIATASGLIETAGSASGRVAVTAAAAGVAPTTGAGTGAVTVTASATGFAAVIGAASGSTTGGILALAEGLVQVSGTASGLVTIRASASGLVGVAGISSGTVSGESAFVPSPERLIVLRAASRTIVLQPSLRAIST
jgi:hypothetical protein